MTQTWEEWLLFKGTLTVKAKIEETLLKHRKNWFTIGCLNAGGQLHQRGGRASILGDIQNPAAQSLGQPAQGDLAWAKVGWDDLQRHLPPSTSLWHCMAVPLLRQRISWWAPQGAADLGGDADCSPFANISWNLNGANMGRVAGDFFEERQQKVMTETSYWGVVCPAGLEWRCPAGPEPLLEDKPRGFSLEPCFISFPPTLISSDALQTFGLYPEVEKTCPEGGAEESLYLTLPPAGKAQSCWQAGEEEGLCQSEVLMQPLYEEEMYVLSFIHSNKDPQAGWNHLHWLFLLFALCYTW